MYHAQSTTPFPAPTLTPCTLAERQRELSGWHVLCALRGEFYGSTERKRERLLQALARAGRIEPPLSPQVGQAGSLASAS